MENTNIKNLGNYLRYLAAMGIQRAKSGHPGLPLGCADIGITLYSEFIKGTAAKPDWLNRDRFILSAGHGSMLVYALNYIFGYDLTIKDLADFRQLHSKTAGHPEYEHGLGIETTTGPLAGFQRNNAWSSYFLIVSGFEKSARTFRCIIF